MRGVYLLHFEPRFHHAGHYIGFAEDIYRRLYEHEYGQSNAKLVKAAVAAGCKLILARVWQDADRNFERSLKGGARTGKAPRGSKAKMCPLCRAAARAAGKGKAITCMNAIMKPNSTISANPAPASYAENPPAGIKPPEC